MSGETLVGLPVDGRPVVRAQVQQLVALSGARLRCPPVEALGHFREPADREALADWLRAQARVADAWVLSADMLVYGGLIPSRFIPDDEASLRARLALLSELKAARPQAPMAVFAATMRISNNCIADEEKPYWSPHGADLWAWSYHSDRAQQTGAADSLAAAAAASARVPVQVRDDYVATRARNLRINQALLDAVEQGVIDRLILPQDDTAEFGFNIAERRLLQAQVQARGLQDRVAIYAGADEVMHTLCAWTVQRLRALRPLRLRLLPTDAAHWQRLVPRYEDHPLPQAVAAQVAAVGAQAWTAQDAPPQARADVALVLHSQGPTQGDWAMRVPLAARPGVDTDIWSHVQDVPLAVADLAYANGGDPLFVEACAALHPVNTWVGYAGWNTASNRLGSLLAQLSLARDAWHSAANQAVLALRLAEDLQWQAVWRQVLRDECALDHAEESRVPPAALQQRAQALMLGPANDWLARHDLPQRVRKAWLPWQRSFEIGLEVQ